jgi:hypothetical protein
VPSVPWRVPVDATVELTSSSFVDQPLFGLLLKFDRNQCSDRCFQKVIRESHHLTAQGCFPKDDELQQ